MRYEEAVRSHNSEKSLSYLDLKNVIKGVLFLKKSKVLFYIIKNRRKSTGIPCFVLCFIDLGCCFFFLVLFCYKWKARSPTSKKIKTHLIATFTLLQWSGIRPLIYLRYACNATIKIILYCLEE